MKFKVEISVDSKKREILIVPSTNDYVMTIGVLECALLIKKEQLRKKVSDKELP